MRYYIKRPEVVPAVQWTGENVDEVTEFCDKFHQHPHDSCYESFRIGRMVVWVEQAKSYTELKPGQWIISTSDGHGIKVHDESFLDNYDEVAYEVSEQA